MTDYSNSRLDTRNKTADLEAPRIESRDGGWGVMGGRSHSQRWAWFAIDRKAEAEWYVAHLEHVGGTAIHRMRAPNADQHDALPPIPSCERCGRTWECDCRPANAVEVRLAVDATKFNAEIQAARAALNSDRETTR